MRKQRSRPLGHHGPVLIDTFTKHKRNLAMFPKLEIKNNVLVQWQVATMLKVELNDKSNIFNTKVEKVEKNKYDLLLDGIFLMNVVLTTLKFCLTWPQNEII